MTPRSPEPRATSPAEAGRACPYCRFALKQGAAVVECSACHALHHEECWADNGGCAIMGCAGAGTGAAATAPEAATTPIAVPPPRMPASPQPAATYATAPPPQPAPPSGGGSGRSNTALILAVLVLALAVAGGAAALVLSTDKGVPTAQAGPTTVTQVVSTTAADTTNDPSAPTYTVSSADPESEGDGTTTTDADTRTIPDTGTASASTGALPDESKATMASDITSVLLAHHEAIVNRDFRAAWVLTSQRYRAKKLREPGGYAAWETAQSSLSRYLDPSGLHVSILDTDPHSGVATIRVTDMGWSAPRSPCSTWQGVTWARYENGHWRYEPGYSISDQRRAEWQPRRDALLGWGC